MGWAIDKEKKKEKKEKNILYYYFFYKIFNKMIIIILSQLKSFDKILIKKEVFYGKRTYKICY
jgi:hypothetical protein